MVNLSAQIRCHALRSPGRLAMVYEDQRVSYSDFDDRIRAMAGFLRQHGVGPDQVVAVLMKNSAAFLEIAFAVSHVGAVFLPINFRLAAVEVEYIVGDAGPVLMFVDEELVDAAAHVTPKVVVGTTAQRDSRALSASSPRVAATLRGPDDLFRLMYTSGTTDRPKGVVHLYENFYWKCWDQIADLGLSAADRLLVVGPLYHVGAFDLPGVAVLEVGGSLVVLRDFDPEWTLATIERERVTCAWFAPVITGRLLALDGRERFDLSSFRWCIGGGERTPEARIRGFADLFRNARYIDGYGLTETCGGDTLMEAGREIEKIGSTGRALAHVELTIRDGDGEVLPPRAEGEICLRGPKVTRGYWKDPEKTAASFFGDWLRTGDVGFVDEEGFLYLTDRKKDVIISGGENIASSEVERVIYQLPQVAECAVVGLPDNRWGERPVAVVVLQPGTSIEQSELEHHCRAHLAAFKVPRQLVVREVLPRNPSGKVLKRLLRDELGADPRLDASRKAL
jgi:acyl-CoA synthetase (AMP-forming)/AMP-acid ligase II